MNPDQPQHPSPEEAEANEMLTLLRDQATFLWNIYHLATEPPGKVNSKADLANFFLIHSLHIHEMAKTAVVLMENESPYAVTLLARSALESAFNMSAAQRDRQFGPQRIAFEREELARKLKHLIEKRAWLASRRPTPDECLQEAQRIRRDYAAPPLSSRREQDRIEKIERIADTAGLSPFYEDDYRFLSLTVHANQAGVLNSMSGFLVRKGLLACSNAAFFASHVLIRVFGLGDPDQALAIYRSRMETLMGKPDFLPQVHPGASSPTGRSPH
jgi:hypothetical protein